MQSGRTRSIRVKSRTSNKGKIEKLEQDEETNP